MSYIRSPSNPEALYIYGGDDGVWIHHRHGTTVVPQRDFDRIGLVYFEHFGRRAITSGDLSLREVTVFRGTERVCPPGHEHRCLVRQLKLRKWDCRHHHKILLQYRRTKIFMWLVTWHYIAESIRDHVREDRTEARRRI